MEGGGGDALKTPPSIFTPYAYRLDLWRLLFIRTNMVSKYTLQTVVVLMMKYFNSSKYAGNSLFLTVALHHRCVTRTAST